jgi:hypothetical protein
MKKKLERLVFKYKIGITEVDWSAFRKEVDEKVAVFEKDGYKNPMVFSDEYSIWVEMTKIEDDESYATRVAEEKKKMEMSRARRIEKLKKEAKELGLKVGE